jgi:hypothetical protein
MVCPLGRGLPLGVNLAPRGEICPLGEMFTPLFTPRGEHSLQFRRMEGRTENFTPGGNFTHRGQNSPLRDNFAPRGQSLSSGVKYIMGLRSQSYVRLLNFQLQCQRCSKAFFIAKENIFVLKSSRLLVAL